MSRVSVTTAAGSSRRGGIAAVLPTVALLLGAVYCLIPVVWVVVAATKTPGELFSTFSFLPGTRGGLADNLSQLSGYRSGEFWRWGLNTALYAGVGAGLSVAVSAVAGYALAKYRFPGRTAAFNVLLAGVLVPQITLAIPQYLLLAEVGLTDTYWSVLLPSILSPYGIYLSRIYATAAVPDEMVEAARIDGAGEFRIFTSIAVPTMVPGLVTVFLLQFVAVWTNFLLPYIMLADDRKFPLTVGLFTMLNQGADQPALNTLVITGALLAVIPLIALFLVLQRFWSIDLVSGGVKA
ncbi:MAG: carbohydrate ABC transporter permease [Actinomycetales bacterium]|nr:carbohydrate ABC transporter permease [Actinomycetales bacterium]